MKIVSKSSARLLKKTIQKPFLWIAPEETFSKATWPTTLLIRPLPLAAIGLMAFNDHILKTSLTLSSTITGKISDVTGLFFFPLLLITLLNLLALFLQKFFSPMRTLASPHPKQLLFFIILTAVFFTALQLSSFAANVYVFYGGRLLGHALKVTQDVTDLYTLPILIGTWLYGTHRIRGVPPARIHLLNPELNKCNVRSLRVKLIEKILNDIVKMSKNEHQLLWHKLIQDWADRREPQILNEQLAWLRKDC